VESLVSVAGLLNVVDYWIEFATLLTAFADELSKPLRSRHDPTDCIPSERYQSVYSDGRSRWNSIPTAMAPGGTNVVLFDPSVVQIGASRLVRSSRQGGLSLCQACDGAKLPAFNRLLTFVRHNAYFASYFATTLPEPFARMRSNRKNRPPSTASRRLDSFRWRSMVTHSPRTENPRAG
jgi:hypothetical protein